MTHKLSDCFDQAAAYLEEHGWCTGSMKNSRTGAVCLVGALYEVCPTEFDDHRDVEVNRWEPRQSLTKVFKSELSNYNSYVQPAGYAVIWNDSQESADVVIAKAREIAAKLRSKGE